MPKKTIYEKQVKFLEKIKFFIPSNISYVESLAQILDLSNDSVYRRIRGETDLSFTELAKLCHHFKLSMDSAVEFESTSVTFTYNAVSPETKSFKGYLNSILEDLNFLNKINNGKVIYIAEDIPIFHLFAFPELAAFKMYYWLKSVLNVPEYQNQKYSFRNTDPEILTIGSKILNAYSHINSVEIWTEYTVNSLRKQIEYYFDAGLFEDNNDALTICDQACKLVQYISELANNSRKKSDTENINFSLYYSEIEIGNNCILISVNDIKRVYLTYNTFNKMVTSNEKFCEETNTWINYLICKSSLISGISEKQRLQFVNKIIGELENTQAYIRSKIQT